MREQLKSIRSREENLDEMKRRRRAVFRKADDADKKLSKMSPEHKNLQMQVDLLNRLRDEIRALDTDIMVDEAALGDFKRTATKLFLGLKIGGLMECCQKGSARISCFPHESLLTCSADRCRFWQNGYISCVIIYLIVNILTCPPGNI